MSSETLPVLHAAAAAFSTEPIVNSAKNFMQDLSPLLSSESSLEAKINEWIRKVVERFVQATKCLYMATYYADMGITLTCSTLATLRVHSPTSLLKVLRRINEDFLCGLANAKDVQPTYVDLRKDVEAQLKIILETYGPSTIIEVSRLGRTEKNSLQNLGTAIVNNLIESEKSISTLVDVLLAITASLQAFLEDDKVSLDQPLMEMPIWSPQTFPTWISLKERLNRFETNLGDLMKLYPAWFQYDEKQFDQLLEADRETRRPNIIFPDIKVQSPAKPSPSSDAPTNTVTPHEAMNYTVMTGNFRLVLKSVDQSVPGVSSLTMQAVIISPSTWRHPWKQFQITFEPTPRTATEPAPAKIQITSFKPATVKELINQSGFEPKNSKPAFKVKITPATGLKWTFTRPWLRFGSNADLPTQFTLSFDLEHAVPADIRIGARFVVRRTLKDFLDAGIYLTGSQTIYPRTKPVDEPPSTDPPSTSTGVSSALAIPSAPLVLDQQGSRE